jgi:peptidylprolyl isomerase
MRRLRARPLRWLCSIMLLLGCAVTSAACTSSAAQALPDVTGAYGADPQIALPDGTPPSGLVIRTLIQGSGPVIGSSDMALVYVEGKVWAGDREVFDSYTDRQPQSVPLATGGVLPAWRQLAGQRVGSRVLMVVPPADGFGSQGNQQLNILGGDTLVFVFDLLSTIPETAAAHGATVAYHPAAGMPAVTDTTGAAGPKITVPAKAAPPTSLIVKTLIKGDGPPLTSGQTVVVQYSGVVWRSNQVFDSSYATKTPDSFVLGANQVIPGWEQGLGGVTVGSRVLLIIPPALAYGDQAEPPYINDDDTLVFVIDVIDSYTPQTA